MITPDPTTSPLLNRLLQRQVAQLEAENAALKQQLAKIETRVTDSTERHFAINASLAEEIARATREAQSLSTETEYAAGQSIQAVRTRHDSLTTHDIQEEHEQLVQQLQAFYGTIQTLKMQAKRDTALVVRRANQTQEQLLLQLSALYDSDGNLAGSASDAYLTARQVLEQVSHIRNELATTLGATEARHLALANPLHNTNRALVVCLQQTSAMIERLRHDLEQGTTNNVVSIEAPAIPVEMLEAKTAENALATPAPQDDLVLEAARRAFARQQNPNRRDSSPTMPQPILTPPRPQRSFFPNNAVVASRTFPLLPIGIGLMAFVVVITAMMFFAG